MSDKIKLTTRMFVLECDGVHHRTIGNLKENKGKVLCEWECNCGKEKVVVFSNNEGAREYYEEKARTGNRFTGD